MTPVDYQPPTTSTIEARGRNLVLMVCAIALIVVSATGEVLGLMRIGSHVDTWLNISFILVGNAGIMAGLWGLHASYNRVWIDDTVIKRRGLFGWTVPWSQLTELTIRPHGESFRLTVQRNHRFRYSVLVPDRVVQPLVTKAKQHGIDVRGH